jgi:cytochrome c oxidase subunit 2
MVVLIMNRAWRAAAGITIALAAVSVPADRALARAPQPPLVVEVSAERFSYTPSEIRAKAGTILQIRLTSEDTDHGFRIPGTKIDVRIPKRNRGTTTVTFDAAKPGRYPFECSHVCGAGHSFMRGTIVVTE